MNRIFKKQILSAVAVLATALAHNAEAQDLFDESFLSDNPAPAAAPQEPQQAQAEAEPLPDLTPTAPVQEAAAPAEEPAPAQPSLGAFDDFSAPPPETMTSDMSLPPPTDVPMPGNVPSPSFGSSDKPMMGGSPSDNIVGKMSSDIFREMAEMERENNNLALQLKKESLQAEIDTLKANKRKTLFDEIERREKMTQARLEWELAQDLKRQEALERKQRAEIRQEQIKAALKAEEERRKKAEEDKARAERERVQKEENEKKAKEAEERERVHAAALSANAKLVPVQISVARPDKLKRPAEMKDRSSNIVMTADGTTGTRNISSLSAVAAAAANTQDEEKTEVKKVAPAGSLYAVTEIRGIGGTLIAKLLSKSDKSSFFVKKETVLPSGHIVINITKDYVMLRHGTSEEIVGFSSAGLIQAAEPSKPEPEDQTAAPEKKKNTPRKRVSKRLRFSAVSANK